MQLLYNVFQLNQDREEQKNITEFKAIFHSKHTRVIFGLFCTSALYKPNFTFSVTLRTVCMDNNICDNLGKPYAFLMVKQLIVC
ncbi:hypothetical protein GDO86_016108 [Hymenochirus boettgeri]|uniref:Uncharacterized protein n=1 Tax=Hymenochirus boettgeri TaxID=247094 RepID=A0A8T2JVQ1_9PIPI|nr:hypothetical protein GDO86_016108 [Hymenochirus boettgeri]